MAAGSIITPDDALKAVELGLPLVAIGHALIMNPTWVEMVANGREAEVDSELNVSKLDQLNIPEKLWNVIQAMPGWFNIGK
jgi:2,4-dienoyl-CoA reductase-like NADH-dependent reductase (Old Yellow Enzyme family)